MAQGLIGSYSLLIQSPIWLTFAVLYFFTIGIFPLGRRIFDGRAYNVAFSSQYGDVALIVSILISASVLQGTSQLPVRLDRLNSLHLQTVLAGLAILVGIIIEIGLRWQTPVDEARRLMDVYHNLFVLPLFLYLLASTLPITYLLGSRREITASVISLLIWLFTLLIDIRSGRLDQAEWLRRYGTPL